MIYKSNLLKICSLLILIFLAGAGDVYSQEYKAVALSGSCEIQKGSVSWTKLNAGDKIKSSDKIRVNKDSYAGLIDNSGKTIELKIPGIYTKKELAEISAGRKNVFQKFAGYLISESVVQKKSDNMKTLGAVVRGHGDQIDLFFPLRSSLIEKDINLKWFSTGSGQMYLVKILNDGGTFLSIYETKDTSINLQLEKFGFIKGNNYRLIVSNSNREEISSDTVLFNICNNSISDDYKNLVNESSTEPLNAVDQLIMIKWFSTNNLNYEALLEYDKLKKSNPGIETINKGYSDFLLSQGIKEK